MLDIVQVYFIVMSFAAHPPDNFEEAMDALMDALMDVGTITDPDITVSLESGSIEVAMYVKARSNNEAIAVAKQALAEAIHNSGGLADWEQQAEDALRDERYEASVRPAGLISA